MCQGVLHLCCAPSRQNFDLSLDGPPSQPALDRQRPRVWDVSDRFAHSTKPIPASERSKPTFRSAEIVMETDYWRGRDPWIRNRWMAAQVAFSADGVTIALDKEPVLKERSIFQVGNLRLSFCGFDRKEQCLWRNLTNHINLYLPCRRAFQFRQRKLLRRFRTSCVPWGTDHRPALS